MDTINFVYYHEESTWVGWLEECSQGDTIEELKENLRDIYRDIRSETFLKYVAAVNWRLDEKGHNEILDSLAKHIDKMLK